MTQRLRVLHVVGSLELGGGQKLTALVAGSLDRRRFDVEVLSFGRTAPYGDYLAKRGVPVHGLDLKFPLRSNGIRALVRAMVRLLSLLFQRRWDVVHTHMFLSAVLVAPLARLAGARVFGTTHRIYYAKVQPPVERLMAPLQERIVVDSLAVREILRARTRIPVEKYVVIHNGIDLDEFSDVPTLEDARERLGLASGPVVVTEVAHLEAHKGQLHLLEAFAQLPATPETLLLIVGDGSMRGQLEARAEELALGERVRFVGARGDLPIVLIATDVLALPSTFEGFGIIQAEAMYLQRPVVATSFGGSLEVVDDGENGYLVPFGDVKALAARLTELVSDPALRAAMGAKGRAKVLREFTSDVMAGRYADLYLRTEPAAQVPDTRHGYGVGDGTP